MSNSSNKNHPMLLRFNYLMMEYFDTKDPQYAEKALLLFKTEKLKAVPHKDGKWLFIMKSNYKSKCKECGKEYQKGDGIFCQDTAGYHPLCAPSEAREPSNDCFSLYQKWMADKQPIIKTAIIENNNEDIFPEGD